MCELSDIEYMLNMIEKAKNNEAENTENPLWGLNRIAIYIADYMLGENTYKSKYEVKGEFINYFNSDAAKKWQATLKTFIKADSADGGSIQSCVCEFFKNERKVFETMWRLRAAVQERMTQIFLMPMKYTKTDLE